MRSHLPLPLPRFGAFDRLFDDLIFQAMPTAEPTATPRLDIWEDETRYGIHVELPGFELEDVDLTVHDGELSLVANQSKAVETSADDEVEAEAESPARTWHRRERVQRQYARRIQLPKDVDTARAAATLANGVLEIVLPKTEVAKPLKIDVKR